MENTCLEFQEQLSLSGQTNILQQAALKTSLSDKLINHLAECSECHALWKRLQINKILDDLSEPMSKPFYRKKAFIIGCATIAIIGLLLYIFFIFSAKFIIPTKLSSVHTPLMIEKTEAVPETELLSMGSSLKDSSSISTDSLSSDLSPEDSSTKENSSATENLSAAEESSDAKNLSVAKDLSGAEFPSSTDPSITESLSGKSSPAPAPPLLMQRSVSKKKLQKQIKSSERKQYAERKNDVEQRTDVERRKDVNNEIFAAKEKKQDILAQMQEIPSQRQEKPSPIMKFDQKPPSPRMKFDKVEEVEKDGAFDKNKAINKAIAISPAKAFLNEMKSLESVTVQEAAGYWANTYIPGDPAIRRLRTSLPAKDRGLFQAMLDRPIKMEDAALQPLQPFDPPENSVIGLYLSSNVTGIEHDTRMIVQVGIKGSSRKRGVRPAMNIGIVLDWEGAPSPETQAAFHSLVSAFEKVKDIGDRFSLTIAGKPGGLIIPSTDFRYGPIKLAMQRLIDNQPSVSPILSLTESIRKAYDTVRSADDPNAPLGSSVVILVTHKHLGEITGLLADIAHQNAVDGIPLTTVGISDSVNQDELDQLALAGQGNRYLLLSDRDAKDIAEKELNAVSRVIARALRLRIRLAPQVKLVDVIGSYRLDRLESQKVRDAEKSVDLKISRSMGIEADRGDDEEGIQIVIPAYYTNDAHVILLDVIATSPGTIMDVTARYKDLIHLKNGVIRTRLDLSREVKPDGPLEINVFKNYLASQLSTVLKDAGQSLGSGDISLNNGNILAASKKLQAWLNIMTGLKLLVNGLERDTDIYNDMQMLDEYLALLNGQQNQEQQNYIAQSLELAGYLKMLPRSATVRE
ncbi:MAG: hypothetical protein HQK67_07825 [Desulfamplus sp.]|nr:hypothetical protein [Desulfamplus sp.]